LGVNVIWGALIHLAPEKSVVSLSIDPRRGTLKNNGTLRVPLRRSVFVTQIRRVNGLKKTRRFIRIPNGN
jgi:hypothetical protein